MNETTIALIFQYVKTSELGTVARTCRYWRTTVKTNLLVFKNREPFVFAKNYKQYRKYTKRKVKGVTINLSGTDVVKDAKPPRTDLSYIMHKHDHWAPLFHLCGEENFHYGTYVTIITNENIIPNIFKGFELKKIKTHNNNQFEMVLFKTNQTNRNPIKDILSCFTNHERTIDRQRSYQLGRAFYFGYFNLGNVVACKVDWERPSLTYALNHHVSHENHSEVVNYMLGFISVFLCKEDFLISNITRIGDGEFLALQFNPMLSSTQYRSHFLAK